MTELVSVFVIGLLGSAHCVGMCGGFAAALGARNQPLTLTVGRQIVYSLGRIFTYAFLGVVGGFAGLYLSRFNWALVGAQQLFSILAGAIMLLIGVSALGLVRFRRFEGSALWSLVTPLFGHFLSARSWPGFFLAGLANGFLPCGLVYAFLALAVAGGDVVNGLLLMCAFGAGTVPAMVGVGCGAAFLGNVWRGRIYRAAACFVIVAGLVTIWRATAIRPGDCCVEPDAAGQSAASGAIESALTKANAPIRQKPTDGPPWALSAHTKRSAKGNAGNEARTLVPLSAPFPLRLIGQSPLLGELFHDPLGGD